MSRETAPPQRPCDRCRRRDGWVRSQHFGGGWVCACRLAPPESPLTAFYDGLSGFVDAETLLARLRRATD